MNRSLHHNIRTIYLLGFFNSFMVINPVFVPLLQGHGLWHLLGALAVWCFYRYFLSERVPDSANSQVI